MPRTNTFSPRSHGHGRLNLVGKVLTKGLKKSISKLE